MTTMSPAASTMRPRAVVVRVIALWAVAVGGAALAVWLKWTIAAITIEVSRAQGDLTSAENARIEQSYSTMNALSGLVAPCITVAALAGIAAVGIHAWLWSRGGRIDPNPDPARDRSGQASGR